MVIQLHIFASEQKQRNQAYSDFHFNTLWFIRPIVSWRLHYSFVLDIWIAETGRRTDRRALNFHLHKYLTSSPASNPLPHSSPLAILSPFPPSALSLVLHFLSLSRSVYIFFFFLSIFLSSSIFHYHCISLFNPVSIYLSLSRNISLSVYIFLCLVSNYLSTYLSLYHSLYFSLSHTHSTCCFTSIACAWNPPLAESIPVTAGSAGLQRVSFNHVRQLEKNRLSQVYWDWTGK